MIELRELSASEFAEYRTISTNEYHLDLQRNHPISADDAMEKATSFFDAAFPESKNTAIHCVFGIEVTIDNIKHLAGYLWYMENEPKAAFILDVYMDPAYRGRGYAQMALTQLSDHLRAAGFIKVGLRVEPDNKSALKAYTNTGFHITGYNMIKPLQNSEKA